MKPSSLCETPRLILREFHENDLEAIFGFIGDAEVMRFSLSGAQTREEIKAKYLPSCFKRYAEDGLGLWATVRKSDSVCIGGCGICVQEIDGAKEFEVGYRLRRDCWGMGLATEAAAACRDYGFNKVGLRRLISIIGPENTASINVARKIGMALEKKAMFYDIPVLVYNVQAR